MSDYEKIVCMATDAFRVCLGLPTRNFTPAEVARFIQRRAAPRSAKGE